MAWSWQSVVCVNAMQQLKRLVTLLCQQCNYYSQPLKMKGEEWQWIMKPFSLMKLVPWYTSGRRVRLMMELCYICYNIKNAGAGVQLWFAATLNKSKKSIFDKLNSSWQCSYHFYCTTGACMHFRLYHICHIYYYKQLIITMQICVHLRNTLW